MNKTAITSPELTPPIGPFSQAIEVGGFLYFSGQVAHASRELLAALSSPGSAH